MAITRACAELRNLWIQWITREVFHVEQSEEAVASCRPQLPVVMFHVEHCSGGVIPLPAYSRDLMESARSGNSARKPLKVNGLNLRIGGGLTAGNSTIAARRGGSVYERLLSLGICPRTRVVIFPTPQGNQVRQHRG